MSAFCPHYPKPHADKASPWRAFWGARRSWLDTLYERSYSMQMGEVSLLNSKLFMVNDPQCVKQLLQERSEDYPKHALMHEALRPVLGESIFTTSGGMWKRHRQMMNPSFGQTRIQVSFRHMQAAVDAMAGRLLARREAAIDVQAEMTLVAADIIFRTIFSRSIDEAEALAIFHAFADYQELAPKLILPAVYGFSWLTPWGAKRRSAAAAHRIRTALQAMIEPRRRGHAARTAAADYAPQDILDSLLDARDAQDGTPFDANELLDQVAMLFLAGHETSASAMAWALHLLAHSPGIQQRMRIERAALAHELQPADLRELRTTWNVFRETLRLFPPVGFFARSVAKADRLRDKQIRPGDSVVIAPWLIHRHRLVWSAPDAFDPDRFDRDDAASKAALRDAYLPFGSGPRVCIGASFAQQEATLVLSRMVALFEIAPADGHTPEPVGRLTIRSDNGIWVKLRPFATDVPQP
jgi:cytochrome P450